jgi:hypothetical protein
MMMLLAQEEGPSFFRVLAPVLVLVALAVFGWLSEKAKKKEQERQAEEDAQRRSEGQARTSQVRPTRPLQQAPRPVRARSAEQIQRYQPEIPPGPERQREWLEPGAEEAELIIVAEDVSDELARQRLHERRQRQIRAQAVHRTQAVQAQRRQRAALQAKLAAEKAAKQKSSRALHDGKVLAEEAEVLQPVSSAVPLVGRTSAAQLRQAIVWAEILGLPLALRPQQQRL